MKLEAIFEHPIKVLQIFCDTYAYAKEERAYSERKGKMNQPVSSKSGYVVDNKLYLPETILEFPNLKSCSVITIEEHNFNKRGPLQGGEPFGSNRCLDLAEPVATNIFELRQEETLELYLAGEKHDFPKRKNFKVCALRQGEPVEIKINFKTSYALWGTERYLSERSYIYEYIGDFDRCQLMREPYDAVIKQAPADRKVVNLLKELWM